MYTGGGFGAVDDGVYAEAGRQCLRVERPVARPATWLLQCRQRGAASQGQVWTARQGSKVSK